MTSIDERRDYKNPKFQDFAVSVGQITLAWNSLHLELFGIFWAVTGYANGLIPGAMWHSLKVDNAQREMLKNLIKKDVMGLDIKKNTRNRIDWLIKKVSDFSNIRNDFIHTTFALGKNEIIPIHVGTHTRALSFEGRDICGEAEWLFNSITILAAHAAEVTKVIRKPEISLPPKPDLPSRPRLKTS